MATVDPATLTLTGQLPLILISGALLALPVSFLLLRLYRRAVLNGMNRRCEGDLPFADQKPPASSRTTESPRIKLVPISLSPQQNNGPPDCALFQGACAALRRAGLVYTAAGLIFAATMALCFLLSTQSEVLPLRFLMLMAVYVWPLGLTLLLVAITKRKQKVLLVSNYVAVFSVLAGAILARSPESSLLQLITLWFGMNLPPTLLLLVFSIRKLRAVGPMVVICHYRLDAGFLASSIFPGSSAAGG